MWRWINRGLPDGQKRLLVIQITSLQNLITAWAAVPPMRLSNIWTSGQFWIQIPELGNFSRSCNRFIKPLSDILAPNRRQAIIWGNDGIFHYPYMRHSAPMSFRAIFCATWYQVIRHIGVNKMLAGGMMPLWRQRICNRHCDLRGVGITSVKLKAYQSDFSSKPSSLSRYSRMYLVWNELKSKHIFRHISKY